MKKKYKKIIEQFKIRSCIFEKSARWIKDEGLLRIHQDLALLSGDELILDACCGSGVVAEKLLYNGAKVLGVDLSLEMLKKARKRIDTCINAAVENLPFKDNTFDLVVCRQAFHFLEIFKAIREFFRVTKTGGRIVISQIVPFGREDSSYLYKIHKKIQPALKNFLFAEDLINILKKVGYRCIKKRSYYIEESINDWIRLHGINKNLQKELFTMFKDAPFNYKKIHSVRILDGKIFEKMRWVILSAKKPKIESNDKTTKRFH